MPVNNDELKFADLMELVRSGRELTSEISLDILLRRILEKAGQLTHSPDTSLILHNENRNTLYFAAATGPNAAMLLERFGQFSEHQVPVHGSKAGEVFLTGKSIVVDRVQDDPGHYKGVDQETKSDTESMVCVPLVVGGKALGVVQILNKGGNYDKRDVFLLEHFASQAAVAIRNAQLFDSLMAHMGLYTSRDGGAKPLELMEELDKPARPETLTVMFADMRGFTQLCQVLNSPTIAQERLSEFVVMLGNMVLQEGGMVNKFLGDGLMALFRGEDHAGRAVRCAFRMVERFSEMRQAWDERSNVVLGFLDIGVGIATDTVILGTIGNERVRDFTVIGNAVNLAAAFESHARDGRRILVDQMTYSAVKDDIGDIDGPEDFVLRKPGQSVGHPYKQYHLKNVRKAIETRVFISHSHLDRELVEKQIIPPLRAIKVETWYAQDSIPKGAAWARAIRQGLSACDWMIVVVSKNSAASQWVRKEVDLAISDDRLDEKIIPVVVDDTPLDQVNKWLVGFNAIDLRDEDDLTTILGARFDDDIDPA